MRTTSRPTSGPETAWGHGTRGQRGEGFATPRVLFPYDGSPVAWASLDVAAEWALALRAEVWVLYVRPCDVSRGGHYYVETRTEARALATEAVARLRSLGVAASGKIRSADRGRVTRAILAEADALDARVIVLGTHARGALAAAVRGSTSRSVARRATRPVVLVKPAGGQTPAAWPGRPGSRSRR